MTLAAATFEWTLGDRLRKTRIDAKLDQAEIALQVGVSRPTVSKWERNHSEPKVSELVRWAQVTGTTIGTLVGEGSTSARLSHVPLSLLPPIPGRRHPSAPANPLLMVVKDE